MARNYRLKQGFIALQKGVIELITRTSKEQYAHRHRFKTQRNATHVIGEWIHFYNTRRPYQVLGMETPTIVCVLAARTVQKRQGITNCSGA